MILEENIGTLIKDVELTITSHVKHHLAPFNLAPEQNLIMMLLWKKDGISPYQIAEQLKKDKGSITRMLSSLESKGFILKVNDAKDHRSIRIYLTESGKKLSHLVIPAIDKIQQNITSGITKEELTELKRILIKIRENARND